MILANLHSLWLIAVILVGGFLLWHFSKKIARRKLQQFGPADRLPMLLQTVNFQAKNWKYWMIISALCLLALVVARPMIGPRSGKAAQSGTDFYLVLDVSNSMLVRDVTPNRLEAVKASLDEWLKTRKGDRIGLVIMAGDAYVEAPLTNDYAALRAALAQTGPSLMSRGGTNIAGAIETGAQALKRSEVKKKIMVLISDGENLEGNAIEAARKAYGTDQLTILAVGVGTPEGGPVPEPAPRGKPEDFTNPPKTFIKDEYGLLARSRMDERTLTGIATAGGGRFFRFTPDVWNTMYTTSLLPLAQSRGTVDVKDFDEFYLIPLAASLLLLAWEMAISSRQKKETRSGFVVILPKPGSAPSASKMKTAPRSKK